jgi:hypothetical protein
MKENDHQGEFMKVVNRVYEPLLGILVVVMVMWLGRPSSVISSKFSPPSAVNISEQEPNKPPRDPCWFMTLEDKSIPYEVISKREDREMYGYPTEIPLSEAIKVFNEEKQCVSTLAPYPPLTEDELIAAIVAGPGYGTWGEVWQVQQEALWKIATRKVMPKGSLLVAASGSRVQESPLRPYGTIRAQGISIAIFLGMKNHKYGEMLKREQIFEIRRVYSKVETVK